jgi:hypothetical protein
MNHDHVRRVVEMANATIPNITDDFASIKRICDAAELVWAVWQDPSEMKVLGR